MNPLCSCGCGREVSYPHHKWILGHSSQRKLSGEDVRLIKRMLVHGISQYKIARWFGVSQATIYRVKYGELDARVIEHGGPRLKPVEAREQVMRQEDIDEHKSLVEEKKWIRESKKLLKKLRLASASAAAVKRRR